MAKLNQIVAVVNGKKTETKKEVTHLHRQCSVTDLFNGMTRVYHPLDEEGERFPDESKSVQLTVSQVLTSFEESLTDLFDVVLTQDSANCTAKADIIVEENVIAKDVPVTYLMFIEKQLHDVAKFIECLPTLDIATRWNYDVNEDLYVSDETKTNKTKKVLQHKVLYEATKEHPAQIEKWTEDTVVGNWSNTKFSGCITQVRKKVMLERVKKLQEAVKFAREQANSIYVEEKEIGKNIFAYICA